MTISSPQFPSSSSSCCSIRFRCPSLHRNLIPFIISSSTFPIPTTLPFILPTPLVFLNNRITSSFPLWQNSNYEDGGIIRVLDTGIWPKRPSFSDSGLSAVPSSWKGSCETGPDFPASACNRKIIGAKAFYRGYESYLGKSMDEATDSKSPRDPEGHGTHTAAGSVVANASFFHYASGEARGMATRTRIAAYKICWSMGCFDSDILAAMDEAIADGVDVISFRAPPGIPDPVHTPP